MIRESPITPIFLSSGTFVLFAWNDRITSFFVIGSILVFLKHFYVMVLRPDSAMKYPLLDRLVYPAHGSHRGGAHLFGPENTMYNFRRCVNELGTDILEIDLRLSSDGHVVLVHDNTVDRTTNEHGLVSKYTLAELKTLDAAWDYPDLRSTGIQIPSLDEVLAEFRNSDVIFFFDVKDDAVIELLPSIIERWNIKDQLIFGAVAPAINKRLMQLFPDIPICPDFITVLKMILLYCFGLSWILPSRHPLMGTVLIKNLKFISHGLFSDWKSRKMKIILFGDGLNDGPLMKDCMDVGADILLTDRPDLLRNILGPKKKLTVTL